MMKNILGDGDGDEVMGRAYRFMGVVLVIFGVSIYWYEKFDMKFVCKMGYFIVVGLSVVVVMECLDTFLRVASGDKTSSKKAV